MNANNILPNCFEGYCHNDETDKNYNYNICKATAPAKQSLSIAAELLACSSAHQLPQSIQYPKCTVREKFNSMEKYDKHSSQSFLQIWHIQCTIIVTLLAITLARISSWTIDDGSINLFKVVLRYLVELIVILLPVILSINVANPYVELIVLMAVLILILIRPLKCWELAATRVFKIGQRPSVFTLMRSSINIITAACILAVDFESFPKEFRKTRRYGVGLMDVGIGMFVFSMGLVAPLSRKFSDFRRQVYTGGYILILGLSRTLIIKAIDYHQDEHEYGIHLNAFFTLGLTKLFAAILGYLTKSNNHLLILGSVILLLHEAILQCGVSQYVMNSKVQRINFINANREGICSLPGFVALYLFSQYLGKWIQAKDILNFEEFKRKFKSLCVTSFILWLLVALAIVLLGIARVTCNLGYVLWILAIVLTILTFYLFVFDIVLDTLIPTNNEVNNINFADDLNWKTPVVADAVNFNGLTFFLLANILTGAVNIYFSTEEKTNLESVCILFIYMLITTTFICILHYFKIRIA